MKKEEMLHYSWEILCCNKTLCTVALILSFWAGSVNAIASVSILFARVSHMTGPATEQARYFLVNPLLALLLTITIASFVLGAMLGTRALIRFGLTGGLLLAAAPLFLSALIAILGYAASAPESFEAGRFAIAFLLPLSMGWQNSITSLSGIGRTTHITGDLTDLGIALAVKNKFRSLYYFIKYLGFFSGGIVGYIGATANPALALFVSAIGVSATVLVFHYFNSNAESTVPRERRSLYIPFMETDS